MSATRVTADGEPRLGALQVLKSRPAIALEAGWLYLLAWAVFFAVAAFQPSAGGWEFEGWILTGALLGLLVLTPVYLSYCARHRLVPQFRRWLPWVVRVMYVSLILAICDSLAAGADRAPLFSKATWLMRDGGTSGSVGFGYSLTYHRKVGGGEHGPEVWFWFLPFTVSCTTERVGLRWLW